MDAAVAFLGSNLALLGGSHSEHFWGLPAGWSSCALSLSPSTFPTNGFLINADYVSLLQCKHLEIHEFSYDTNFSGAFSKSIACEEFKGFFTSE